MGLAFGVEDFFAVGLGLDLAGAYLLARGLLTALPDIATARTFIGMGAQSAVRAVQNKIDGTSGLLYLTSGFLLQAGGYLAGAAGLEPGKPSTGRALTFAALTACALLAGLLLHRIAAPRRTRALALRVTCLHGLGLPLPKPGGKALLELGIELGDDARPGETYGQYALRVWGSDDVSEADELPNKNRLVKRQPGRRPVRRRG